MVKFIILFDPQWKATVHVVQVVLIIIVIALTVARMNIKDVPVTRASIMGLVMVRMSYSDNHISTDFAHP